MAKRKHIVWLLASMIWLPMALSDEYPEGDYLHHLWRLQDDANRDQESYMNQWRENQNAPRFCAIAYSASTYNWGYSWGKSTRGDAEQEARQHCGQPDAEILCWSKGSWYCALADGPDAYGAAPGETPEIAKAEAMKIADGHGSGNKIVLLVGGNPPIVKLNVDKEINEAKGSQQRREAPGQAPKNPLNSLQDWLKFGQSPRH